MNPLEKFRPYLLALLRLAAAYMFILHATAKFWEFPVSMTGGQGAVPLMSLYGIGGVIELVGGALLLLERVDRRSRLRADNFESR